MPGKSGRLFVLSKIIIIDTSRVCGVLFITYTFVKNKFKLKILSNNPASATIITVKNMANAELKF
jgi:hypothetical protein